MRGIFPGRRTTWLALSDVGLILLALWVAYALRFQVYGAWLVARILHDWTGASVLLITLYILAFYVFELYNPWLDFRRVTGFLRCLGAVSVAAAFMALASWAMPRWGVGRGLLVLHAGVLGMLTAASRLFSTRTMQTRVPSERALLVTAGAVSDEVLTEIATNPECRFQLAGTIPLATVDRDRTTTRVSTPPPIGTLASCEAVLGREGAHHLLVAGIDRLPPDATREILRMKTHGVEVHDITAVFQVLSARLPVDDLTDAYFLRVQAFTRDTRPVLSNLFRVLDVMVALGITVLSLPLWVLAFLGIKLTMPGPVIYSQERVGKDEVPYTIHKFRSMVLDAERSGPKWATQGDPRVTPFGRFLRRTRIDELPQLWNVLRGDMSLVGPRPERKVFVDQLKEQIPYYGLRFQIKPGLTGWAQVNYKYGSSVSDTRVKLSYDLYYIQERSVALFVLILLKTVQTVLFKPGS